MGNATNTDIAQTAEAALIARCLEGNGAAWTEFYRKYTPVIRREIIRRCSASAQPYDIDDLTQDVFLALLENEYHKLSMFDPQRATIETYLSRVTESVVNMAARNHTIEQDRAFARDHNVKI